jgi:predicted O-methyltransferase YrrM
MYSFFQLAFKYLNYYFTASNRKGHGIHSPFVFDFITKVLNDKEEHADYENPERLRKKLLLDQTILTIEDHGAGSSTLTSKERSVSSIARNALKSKKYAQLLYRVVKYYQPKTIIELGTSLGITTSYLSLAKADGNLFTLEGSKEIANVAKQNFKELGLYNQPGQQAGIKLIEGNFDYTLPSILYHLSFVDLAFIDGNHRREPTVNYFHWLLEKANPRSIFIFDDIHWSSEMEQAWDAIKDHPAVRCSIDLFFIGIIFFRQEFKEKQHFTIRF